MINRLTALLVVMVTVIAYAPAEAYVGPGAGISLIGSTIGLLVAIVEPIRLILLKRLSARKLPLLIRRVDSYSTMLRLLVKLSP